MNHIFRAGLEFEMLGVTFNLPDVTSMFDKGIASAAGWILSFAFMGLMAIWVTVSIIGAYKITRSGMEKEMEEGMTLLKNVWTSASVGLLIFASFSVIGTFLGIGNFTQWNYTLAQCHDAAGGFYFMDIASQEMQGIELTNESVVKCCLINDIEQMDSKYYDAGFMDGTYHYIIDPGGGVECIDEGEE